MQTSVQNLDVSRLGGVVYTVAASSHDFRECHELTAELRLDKPALTFPTILAHEDGELVGFLGTIKNPNMIMAGPLVLRTPRRFVALRLIEAYDSLMRTAGVVTYTMFVANGDPLQDMIDKLAGSYEQIGQNAEGILFARRL